jgi:C4-dicarboxylate transporter
VSDLIRPKVVVLFKVYCWLCAAFSIAAIIFFFWNFFDIEDHEVYATENRMLIMLFAVLCLFPLTASLMGIILKPQPWVWIYNLILICLGMTTGWLVPFCIPLLLFWAKQETKAYYNRTD